MRLWSLHPKYLDPQGLVALWREALLAKAVLRGETRGYTNHPQLDRFKAHSHPRLAINSYLAAVHAEATSRGYAFDRSKLGPVRVVQPIPVSSGQLAHEWGHLQRKLAIRSPAVLACWSDLASPACHPLFRRRPGPVASWERAAGARALRETTAIFQALPQARGYELERVSIGRSASSVYRLAKPGKPTLFLKVSTVEGAPELKTESDCLNWLGTRASVPRVLEFGIEGESAYLLTEALPGSNAVGASPGLWSWISAQVASQLRRLHSLDAEECPFDRTLDRVVSLAATRAASGQVDESDFDAERLGCSAMELLDSLYRERPNFEDIVVTHGDSCRPNMIFGNGSFSGFVDCGRCGRADRYHDLALAHRSIEGNFGSSVAEDFLRAYGLDSVDAKKLSYYRLLDEFF